MSAVANMPSADLHVQTCCNCGVRFALDGAFYRRVYADASWWHCPNGHRQQYTHRANKIDQLTRHAENLQKRLEWAEEDARVHKSRAEHEERRSRAVRGHATRLRRRIAEGKCPCCSKVFPDMAAHIAAKHPRYVPKDEESTL